MLHNMNKVQMLEFPQHGDERGHLVIVEGGQDIPFEIKRAFYIYGSDKDVVRGQHANRKSEFVLINVSGKSKVKVKDGEGNEAVFCLNRPHTGIYLPTMVWKDMYDFSEDSVLLVLSSEHYDASEYIRDYNEFSREIQGGGVSNKRIRFKIYKKCLAGKGGVLSMQVIKYVFQPHGDERGQLIALEEFKDIPFEIKRVYYMYDTAEGVTRGYHAHKSLEQILVCIHGSCKVRLDNGKEKKVIPLEKPYEGLYVANNMWREMYDFSPDAVLMVLASELYDESDYIRNYDEFIEFVEKG